MVVLWFIWEAAKMTQHANRLSLLPHGAILFPPDRPSLKNKNTNTKILTITFTIFYTTVIISIFIFTFFSLCLFLCFYSYSWWPKMPIGCPYSLMERPSSGIHINVIWLCDFKKHWSSHFNHLIVWL